MQSTYVFLGFSKNKFWNFLCICTLPLFEMKSFFTGLALTSHGFSCLVLIIIIIIIIIIIMIWRKHIHKVVPRLPNSGSNWNNFFYETVFEERGNQSTQRKTSQSKGENQEQTQPTHMVSTQDLNQRHIGGRRALCYTLLPKMNIILFQHYLYKPKKQSSLHRLIFVYSKWGLHREFSLIWQDKLKEQRRYWQVY